MGYTDLCVKGTMSFMGIEIPVVSGGFGEDKMCVTDKTIAEIHEMQTFNVRARINSNRTRFKDGIDIIDLKDERIYDINTLLELGYAKQSITQAEHIYLLSERGYAKLIKIMDDDTSWDVHDKLVDDYFNMREKLQNTLPQITRKQQCVLTMFDDNATDQEKVIALQDFGDISRGEACQSVITLDKVEDLIIDTLKDEDVIHYMSRLEIREIFHKTLYKLGYITYKQFPAKNGKRLEKRPTQVPTNSFHEVFADRGLAVVREITSKGDDRGKVEIKYTRFIVKWLQTEQFQQTFLKIARNTTIVPQIEE